MKVAFVLILAFAAVMALTEQERKEEFKKAHEKCNADPATELKREEYLKWVTGGGARPANMGLHALCMSKALGWQDADGKILKEEWKARIAAHIPADKVEEITKTCLVEQDNEVKTAKHLMRCYFDVIRNAHVVA